MAVELIGIAILIAFNLINSRIDAYRIQGLNKTIKHGINFGFYLLLTLLLIWFLDLNWWLFFLHAFFNRQITFDIPLNWRRNLEWDYVTSADPPGAVMDRIEIAIFGRDGRTPVYIYSAGLVITAIILLS